LLKLSVQLYSSIAQLAQIKTMQSRLIAVNVHEGLLIPSLYMLYNLQHMFKMSAFGTYAHACLESCMLLVSQCIDCVFQCCAKCL